MRRSAACCWAVIATFGLVAAGCSQAAEDADLELDAATSTTAPAEPTEDEPGPVVISFIVVDLTTVASALGFDNPDQGDLTAAIEAIVADANENGGLAGRPIVPKVHVFDAITDSPVSEEALCNAITQDDQAFAAVLVGQFQENARPCYAAAETMMLDLTLLPIDRATFEAHAPYLWSPFLPSYDDTIATLADSLIASGWFDGGTVGVVAMDSEGNRRVVAEQLEPRLAAAGVTPASVRWIDPSDGTSLANTQRQAIIDFKSEGVDRVIVVGGARLAPFLMDIARTQNFEAQYAQTSFDQPDFSIENYPDQMVGASGVSLLPAVDVGDDHYPMPANTAEAACLDVLGAAGLTHERRANARTALMYCDTVRLLVAASSDLDELTAETLGAGIAALGDSFESAITYGVAFEAGTYTGGAAYRVFSFDPTCACMVPGADTLAMGQ